MAKIGSAPSGQRVTIDGTEKVPLGSGDNVSSYWALISAIAEYIRTLTQTLTNKTVNLTSNTLTGTTAQFNTALSDNDFATLAGSEALTNKTLTAPTLADFTNATHDHGDADDGGSLVASITITTPTIASFTNANHNHSNAAGGGTISGMETQAASTYTPTRSAEANIDGTVTMAQAQYMRLGATVTVSGRFTADPTLTATATSFEITLPVASNIGAAEDVAGVAVCGSIAGLSAEIVGVVANDTAKVQWNATDITSQTWSFVFCYQVI